MKIYFVTVFMLKEDFWGRSMREFAFDDPKKALCYAADQVDKGLEVRIFRGRLIERLSKRKRRYR